MKVKEYWGEITTKIKEYVKNNKAASVILGCSFLLNIILIPSSVGASDYRIELEKTNETLSNEQIQLNNKISDLEEENQSLEEENESLQAKVDEASPWFEMKEEERKAEEERLEKEKEEAEAKEKEEQERLEKQGYETGITYNQLARTPDDYIGEKVKFKGEVVQVLEGEGVYNIRLAVGGNYDNIIYIIGETSITDQRILENDYITVYGTSTGIYTYESTLGSSISIPSMIVDKVDM